MYRNLKVSINITLCMPETNFQGKVNQSVGTLMSVLTEGSLIWLDSQVNTLSADISIQ